MRRKALVVGISEYDHLRALPACLKDAASMAQVLANNKDEGDGPGTLNYDVTVWPGRTTEGARITRGELRGAMEKLFASDDEVLFHFSGHGYLAASGGFICTTDASRNDYGIRMGEIGAMAAASPARNILVILDCCHAGAAGDAPGQRNTNGFQFATLREGMTVISASAANEEAIEADGHGLFTSALLDGLDGGAADHMGDVLASSLFAYASRRFLGWDQRPTYKSNANDVLVVRKCEPSIKRQKLYQLMDFFRTVDAVFQLDPDYDFDKMDACGNVEGPHDRAKIDKGLLLKDFRDAGLVRSTIPGMQFYWASKHSKTVQLTARGREYWWLLKNKKI